MIGDNLKKLRGNRTQKDIADKLNVARSTYTTWELNNTEPGITHLKK